VPVQNDTDVGMYILRPCVAVGHSDPKKASGHRRPEAGLESECLTDTVEKPAAEAQKIAPGGGPEQTKGPWGSKKGPQEPQRDDPFFCSGIAFEIADPSS
jgi:hypothetical protein